MRSRPGQRRALRPSRAALRCRPNPFWTPCPNGSGPRDSRAGLLNYAARMNLSASSGTCVVWPVRLGEVRRAAIGDVGSHTAPAAAKDKAEPVGHFQFQRRACVCWVKVCLCCWAGKCSRKIRRARERPALRPPQGAPVLELLRRQTSVMVRCSASMQGPAVCV